MTELRTSHPFHMYDAIRQQPERVARVLAERRALIDEAGDAVAARQRIILAGIGSSYHAAHFGEQFLRLLTKGRIAAALEQSFELVHYPLALGRDDAVILISHRGSRNYSVQALELARAAGALTVAITGELGGEGMGKADFLITTCEQELSNAHTKSLTTAMAALARLAVRIADRRKQLAEPPGLAASLAALEAIPEAMRQALGTETAVAEMARRFAARVRIIFVGAGPHWATAREGALKIKETSFIASEGFETEQFLHGPNLEMDVRAALVGLASGGAGDGRLHALMRAMGELGLLRLAVVPTGVAAPPAELEVRVPRVAEWVSPFVHLIPLQWLSYFVAVQRGTNPDNERKENPAHARSREHFRLT